MYRQGIICCRSRSVSISELNASVGLEAYAGTHRSNNQIVTVFFLKVKRSIS